MSVVIGRLASIYGLIAIAVLVCSPSSVALANLWLDFHNLAYTHGFLVAAISLWLVFRARREIAAVLVRPSLCAHIALFVCSWIWIISWRAGLEAVHILLLPVLVWFAVYAAFGRGIARLLAFPLGYLYFGFPLWDWLTPLLQTLSVHAVSLLLSLAGVSAFIDGNLVFIPNGAFEIAGGCAGLHFLVVGLALAGLLGEVNRDTLRVRVALLACMAGLALLTNWIRIFIIVLAGHLAGMHHFLIKDHYTFGWVLFAGAVVLFLWIARALPQGATAQAGANSATHARPSVALAPVACATTLLALVLVPVTIRGAHANRDIAATRGIEFVLPAGKGSWNGPSMAPPAPWQPVFIGATGQWRALYRDSAGRAIEAFAVVYGAQRQGAELVGFGNSLLGAGEHESRDTRIVETGAGRFQETAAIDAHGDRALIWYAYEIGGRRFVTPFLSQVWYGMSSLVREQPSSLFAFRTSCERSCDEARDVLYRFAREMSGDWQAAFRTSSAWRES